MDILEELGYETSKCISCTFCESVCPTLSVLDYRAIYGARGRVLLAREIYKDVQKQGKSTMNVSDAFYSCLDCHACFNVCPAGVNAGHVSELVKNIITSNKYFEKKQEKNVAKMIVTSIMNFGTPIATRKNLVTWSRHIDFDDDSETLLYTGGMYQLMAYSKVLSELEKKFKNESVEKIAHIVVNIPRLIKLTSPMYDPNLKIRMDNVLKSIVTLLKSAGVKFKYLGDDEPYPGSFLFELGYIDEFVEYGKKLKNLFDSNNVKNIITIDPHTYEVLKFTYPKYIVDFNYNVKHYLDFIQDLDFEKFDEEIVYHEPCHFSMHQVKYDEPIKFVSRVGNVTLPQRHGTTSYCCGGPAELLYPKISASISQRRFNELKETGADKIVTACPICFLNLSKDDTVFDLAELLEKRLNKK